MTKSIKLVFVTIATAMLMLSVAVLVCINGATRAAAAAETVIKPFIAYEFNDNNNVGKDSSERFDLTAQGNVTASNGVVTMQNATEDARFDQRPEYNSVLYSKGDASGRGPERYLKSATFSIKFKVNQKSTDMFWPFLNTGNSNRDPQDRGLTWTLSNSDLTICVNHGMSGAIIASNATLGNWVVATVVVDFENGTYMTYNGKENGVYFDKPKDLPAGWTYEWEANSRFSIGGSWSGPHGDKYYSNFTRDGSISFDYVRVYDFAMTKQEVAKYIDNGSLQNQDITQETLKSANELDLSASISVAEGASSEEILREVKVANALSEISIKKSNDAVGKAWAIWDEVEEVGGQVYLKGYITGIPNPNGIRARAKVNTVAAQAIKPVVAYEFNDAQSMLKDSSGNFDLTVAKGAPTFVAGGGAKLENTILYDKGDLLGKDSAEYLKSATFSIKFKVDTMPSQADEFMCIFSTGNYFRRGNSNKGLSLWLKTSSKELLVCAVNHDSWNGAVVRGNLSDNSDWITVNLAFDFENNKYMAFNGKAEGTYFAPSGQDQADQDALGWKKFPTSGYSYILEKDAGLSLGGGYDDGNYVTQSGAVTFDYFRIYDFCMNKTQVGYLMDGGSIKTYQTAKYIADVGNTLTFKDDTVTKIPLLDNMTQAQMIANMGDATVVAIMSDESTKNINVIWNKVAKSAVDNKWYAEGVAQFIGLGIASVAEKVPVKKEVTVTQSFSVTLSQPAIGGTISADKEFGVLNAEVIITPQPDTHYTLKFIKVNGDNLIADSDGAYKIALTENITVTAEFEKTVYTVTVTQPTNGTATVDKNSGVAGAVVTITATPNEHYVVKRVLANQTAITLDGGAYKITLSENVVITVEFEQKVYNVDVVVVLPSGGTAEADKTSAKAGEQVTVSVNPKAGYRVKSVKQGNNVLTASSDGTYIITVSGDSEITVEFAKITYAVTAKNPENGTLTVSKSNALEGDVITITVTPNSGYEISKIMVNGKELAAKDGVYSFTVGKANVEVTGEFKEVKKGCGSSLSILDISGGLMALMFIGFAAIVFAKQRAKNK